MVDVPFPGQPEPGARTKSLAAGPVKVASVVRSIVSLADPLLVSEKADGAE